MHQEASSPRLHICAQAQQSRSSSRDSQHVRLQRVPTDRDMAALVGYRNTVRNHQPVASRPWSARRPPRPRCAPVARRSVAAWEKEFCESNGVPWKKVTDPSAGLNGEGPGGRVARWDDSGAVQALLAAKKRYWAEINGGIAGHAVAVPPLPDPDMYIDVVADDEGGGGEKEEREKAYAEAVEAEYAAAVRDMERAREEGRRMRAAARRDDFVPVPTGWDV